jgi:LPS O-antigen subunit length determinant protein (WzzB/FepE family)
MTEIRPTVDDEIDFVDLVENLWNGRWKIISTTFTAALFGVVFSFVKPNAFVASTHIQAADSSIFMPYIELNNLLRDRGLFFDEVSNENGIKFDRGKVFESFVAEFNDYEEMRDVLRDNDFVKQSIKNLDETAKQRRLTEFAKSFEVILPSNRETQSHLKFQWHDDFEGREIFNDAIHKTLKNVQETAKNNLHRLANIVENQNSLKLNHLTKELNLLLTIEKERARKQLQHLREQSAIATELGIETNTLEVNALTQIISGEIAVNAQANNLPDYLRGYKAINKKIAIIESRSKEEMLLAADGYMRLKSEITFLENDQTESHLKAFAKLIENDNAQNWVEYNLALADSQSQKKRWLYIAISILLGGALGVFYVLASSAIRNRKDELTRA